jgi:hypothetical protein
MAYNKRPLAINYDVSVLTVFAAVLFLRVSVSQVSDLTRTFRPRSQSHEVTYAGLYRFQAAQVFASPHPTFLRPVPNR